MALSNALFAGLSGLDVNQVKLNVVGNNIANANTVSFKSTRVLFAPQFYVTDSGGSRPDGETGGTNPSQRGLGVIVSALEKNFQSGSIETTGRPTDMAIDGDGFFVVKSDEQKYTRDGSFRLNSNNDLVTSGGELVQGYGVDKDFQIVTGQTSDLTIPLGAATTAEATTSTLLEGNLNASGPLAAGASILGSQYLTILNSGGPPLDTTLLSDVASSSDPTTPIFTLNEDLTLAAKKGTRNVAESVFTVGAGSTVRDLMDFFNQALGINNTVTPAAGMPQPGVVLEADPNDPNNQRIMVSGNPGSQNALTLAPGSFKNSSGLSPLAFADTTDINGIASNPTGESVHTAMVVYDSLGTPITVNLTAVLEDTSSAGNTWRFYAESPNDTDTDLVVGTGTLKFDNFGKLQSVAGNTIAIDRANTGAQTPLTLDLDFSRMTSLTSGASELAMVNQDGSPLGRLTGFSIGTDGLITGNFSNGVTRKLGQLVIATFTNPPGLIDRGGNMYVEGANSGTPVVGTPGSLNAGKVVAGALELSNVDLSEEFINLIIASTGFSASSRVISTSDQLLTELLNSNR